MIIMAISGEQDKDRKKIKETARNAAAYYTEESWSYLESGSADEFVSSFSEMDKMDFACIDVTMKDAVPAAEELRRRFSESFMILVADSDIPPTAYIKPTIRAESLMMKPLNVSRIKEVLAEAIKNYMKRIGASDDDKKTFVVEHQGEKNLIEYGMILFFESREKKVFLATEREEYGFYDTLDDLEERLEGTFVRCHRSFIVNKSRIVKIRISAGEIILDDGTCVPLSRSYKPAIKELLEEQKNGNN